MNNRRNVIYVVFANAITILASVIGGFFLPDFFSIGDYASYRVYTLYLTYVGLMHYGIIHGIYLKFSTYHYENLPQKYLADVTKNFFIIELISSFVLALLVWIFRNENTLSYFFVCVNAVILNMQTFFSYINQATERFVKDSVIKIYNSVLLIVIYMILFFTKGSLLFFFIEITFVNLAVMIFYSVYNKDIVCGGAVSTKIIREIFVKYAKIGIWILGSELISVFILNIDSMVINFGFDEESFAVYSLSVSIIMMAYVLIASVSNIVFVYLKKIETSKLNRAYEMISKYIIFGASAFLLTFFPIKWIIINYLPQYERSTVLIKILLITVIYKSINTVLVANIYKLNMLNKVYTLFNCGILALALATDLYALYLNSLNAIAYATVITMICWYIFPEIYLIMKLGRKWKSLLMNNVIILLLYCVFSLAASFDSLLWGGILYAIFYLTFVSINFKKDNLIYYFQKETKNEKE